MADAEAAAATRNAGNLPPPPTPAPKVEVSTEADFTGVPGFDMIGLLRVFEKKPQRVSAMVADHMTALGVPIYPDSITVDQKLARVTLAPTRYPTFAPTPGSAAPTFAPTPRAIRDAPLWKVGAQLLLTISFIFVLATKVHDCARNKLLKEVGMSQKEAADLINEHFEPPPPDEDAMLAERIVETRKREEQRGVSSPLNDL